LQIPAFIIGGLLLGCLAAMGLEHGDRSIRVPEQVLARVDWPLLGVIPRLRRRELVTRQGQGVFACERPGTPCCEAFRNLRIGLTGTVASEDLRSVLVTSAKPGEGKSIVAANLAAACAHAGHSVVLLDADLRRPSLDRLFDIPDATIGLADVLQSDVPWRKALVETRINNLRLLPAGDCEGVLFDIVGTVEMAELLADLGRSFDWVIVDGPPMLGLADARVLARLTDGWLVVLRAGGADERALGRLEQLCLQEGLRPTGLVFNGLAQRHEDLGDYLAKPRPRRRPARSKR
jgi:capsular exopolysaccharide synthesis family protein